MSSETYYLSSLDSVRFAPVRTCSLIRRLKFRTGKECALVRLEPGVIGQDFGVVEDIDQFVITNRHEGEGLSPIKVFPCFVFVARLLIDDIESRKEIGNEDVEIVAWGELYRTKSDAEQHLFN